MQKSLLLLYLTATTPFTVLFMGLTNYYWDYIGNIFASNTDGEVFDFIVVGSGSSGAVVAHRLAQYHKVLLIEAGGDPLYLNTIPGLALDLLGFPEVDWGYKTVPQKEAGYAVQDNRITSNRGKVLGGTSVLNYMLYLRGNPLDYDNWANITGDSEWNFENVLPFFKKSIKEYRGQFKENKKYYESSPYGFMTIEKMNWAPMLDIFLRAAKELGIKSYIDANGPGNEGFGAAEVTQDRGTRMSTHAAILRHLDKNDNIRILKYAQATKIKLDDNGNVKGVWYYHHGVKKFSIASKEVIVSGGSYDSPKLLMLSGIGPKNELQAVGIKPKIDLPVGKNLQDHFGAFLFPITINQSLSFIIERDMGLNAFYDYYVNGKGVLTGPSALNAQGFFSTSQNQRKNWPNIQMFFLPVGPSRVLRDSFCQKFGVNEELYDAMVEPHYGKDGFMLCPILVRPKGRGQVTLKDKNPFSDPLIDPKFLQHPDDLQALVEAFNFALKFFEKTNAFQSIGATLGKEILSSCKKYTFRSDDYWKCHLRHFLGTVWHPVGTCAMGKPSDVTAVVDSKLRVLRTRGLRVIDSSIMPVIINANTNAPAMMIGEKGADLILDYWSKQYLVCSTLEPLFKSRRLQCFYSTNYNSKQR